MKKSTRNAGFTLIELLIVIAVIAILAALAIPNLIGSRKAANETSAISQLRAIITGEESYKARNLGTTNLYATLDDLKAKDLVKWPGADYTKSGYTFADVAAPSTTAWAVKGTPSSANEGDRNFAATNDGFVRAALSAVAVPATAAAIQASTDYQVIQ